MEYIVLDFEMCQVVGCDKRRYPYKNEIIQLGAVRVNEACEIVDEFNAFIKPMYGKINKFIQNLTGIRSKDVKDAETLGSVLKQFKEWYGDGEVKFVSWSDTDYHQICNEVEMKGIDYAKFPEIIDQEYWIDYQRVFGDRYKYEKLVKLEEALELANIDFEGRCHNGLYDAISTAKLFIALEQDPEYKLLSDKITEFGDSDSIGVSLGDILMNKFGLAFEAS